MVGAWSLEILHSVYGPDADWVAELLHAPLLGWNQWVWDRRTASDSDRTPSLLQRKNAAQVHFYV